jgi:VanZ family protein
MRTRLPFAVLFFTWLAALLVLTFYPHLPNMKIRVMDEWFRLDYIGHAGFYAGLSALFLLWQTGWRGRIPGMLIFWTILGITLLGTGNEFVQRGIPGRSFNTIDMACNFAGTIIGVVSVVVVGNRGRGEEGKQGGGEAGKWGSGEVGKWGSGEAGKRGSGEA